MNTIKSYIDHLRQNGAAINFIEAEEALEINEPLTDDVNDFIKQILPKDKQYTYAIVQDRYVVYAANTEWSKKITGIDIRNQNRLSATEKYSAALKNFDIDLEPPAIKGDPSSSVYTELVSMDEEAFVLNHLIQLLGNNARLFFTIEKTQTRLQMIHFGETGK